MLALTRLAITCTNHATRICSMMPYTIHPILPTFVVGQSPQQLFCMSTKGSNSHDLTANNAAETYAAEERGTRKRGETVDERRARKAAVKADKQRKRAAREGRLEYLNPDYGRKSCDLCNKLCDLLIRCQIDESGRWVMVCGGKCWRDVSGGVVDGDAAHPNYRYCDQVLLS